MLIKYKIKYKFQVRLENSKYINRLDHHNKKNNYEN